jgi:hypothetical protein
MFKAKKIIGIMWGIEGRFYQVLRNSALSKVKGEGTDGGRKGS